MPISISSLRSTEISRGSSSRIFAAFSRAAGFSSSAPKARTRFSAGMPASSLTAPSANRSAHAAPKTCGSSITASAPASSACFARVYLSVRAREPRCRKDPFRITRRRSGERAFARSMSFRCPLCSGLNSAVIATIFFSGIKLAFISLHFPRAGGIIIIHFFLRKRNLFYKEIALCLS